MVAALHESDDLSGVRVTFSVPGDIDGTFYREVALVAGMGCLAGAILSAPMTKAVLMGLGSTWQEAAARTALSTSA